MKSVINFVNASLDLQHPEIPQSREEQQKFFLTNVIVYGLLGALFIIAFISFLVTGVIFLVQPSTFFNDIDQ